jgi:hypothetical protein
MAPSRPLTPSAPGGPAVPVIQNHFVSFFKLNLKQLFKEQQFLSSNFKITWKTSSTISSRNSVRS